MKILPNLAKATITITILCTTLAVFGTCDFTPEQTAYFRDLIENEFIPSNNIPGVGFAIVKGDDIFAEGYGFKNFDDLIVANNVTNFAVASLTKSLTATLVVKTLASKFPSLGVSVLNQPIVNLLPSWYNLTLSDRYRSETVTFRDLLSHRSCLSTFFLGRTFGVIKSAEEFAYRTRYVKEICPFRTGYNYNNGMYALLGELLGAVAGIPFPQLARELLSELGMNDTLIISNELDFDNLLNMSRGYYRRDGRTLRFNSDLLKRMALTLPSGGMVPTPRDMIRYMTFHLNLGRLDNRQIVPTNMMRQLQTSSFALDFGIEDTPDTNHKIQDDYAYGLGLRLGIYDIWAVLSHEGTWPPFRSRMSLFPALKIGIFTVTNGPGTLYGVSHQSVHERIFDMLMGKTNDSKELANSEPNQQIQKQFRESVETPNRKLFKPHSDLAPQDLGGLYGNPIHGDFNVKYNSSDSNGQLYLQYGQWGTGYIRSTSENYTYEVEFDSDIVADFLTSSTNIPVMKLSFGTNSDQEDIVVMNFGGENTIFTRNATLDKYPPQIWTPESCSP